MGDKLVALIIVVVTGIAWYKLSKWVTKMDKRNGM